MKFFGIIAHKHPQEIFTKYPVLLNLMFATIDNQDQATLSIALDTLAFVGSTIEGKLCLAALGKKKTLRFVIVMSMHITRVQHPTLQVNPHLILDVTVLFQGASIPRQ